MENNEFVWTDELAQILNEFKTKINPKTNQIMVVGCSTSEIHGQRIGSSGSEQIAEHVFKKLKKFSKDTGISLAFQCCEHLNRAIVIEKDVQEKYNFEEVTVKPILHAGGAMATHAYKNFDNPCVVEHIKADYGIDIGDTLIGMHLKHVAVPVRVSLKKVGYAHTTLARTRPKLIGGERACYK